MSDYTPTTEEIRDALIEGVKLDVRNSIRNDHEQFGVLDIPADENGESNG